MKLMTLNLWCYFDWTSRKDNITKLIFTHDPDIIAFQEVQTNKSFSDNPQPYDIADTCDYKYRVFAPTYNRDGQISVDGQMNQLASFGLGLISKYPIISAETYFLRQHPDHDEAYSVMICKIEIDGVIVDICNVHFGNSDLYADLHLNELMDLFEARKIRPILLGDFNIWKLDAYKQNRLAGYGLTTDVAEYESMPKNSGTLDYIAAPADAYTIKDVYCPTEYVSDHRALLATLV